MGISGARARGRSRSSRVASTLVLGLIVSHAGRAGAEPYSFYAVFSPMAGTAQERKQGEIRERLEEGGYVPGGLAGYSLDRIEVEFSQSKADADLFRTLTYSQFELTYTALDGTRATSTFKVASYKTPSTLLKGSLLSMKYENPIAIVVKHRYSSAFLCGQEAALRRELGIAVDALPKPASGIAVADVQTQFKEVGIQAPLLLAAPGRVVPDKHPVLYTYCAKRAMAWAVPWDEIARRLYDPAVSGRAEAAFCTGDCRAVLDAAKADSAPALPHARARALRRWHKERLLELMEEKNPIAPFVPGKLKHDLISSTAETPNVFLESRIAVTVIGHFTDHLAFEEKAFDGRHALGNVIDQASKLDLAFRHEPNQDSTLPYEQLFAKLVVKLRYTSDGKEADVVVKLKSPDASATRTLEVDLKTYLYKELRAIVSYKIGSKEYTLVDSSAFTVENLGLVTSFPVISEIYTVLEKTNPADAEATSSISFSWAFDIDSGSARQVAITFPWIISYNPRSAPHLSDIVAIFPHASAVFPVSTSGMEKPGLVVGAGVQLARSFYFSFGKELTRDDKNPAYFLVGLGIKELAEFVSARSQ
jgi:hypothetical protein